MSSARRLRAAILLLRGEGEVTGEIGACWQVGRAADLPIGGPCSWASERMDLQECVQDPQAARGILGAAVAEAPGEVVGGAEDSPVAGHVRSECCLLVDHVEPVPDVIRGGHLARRVQGVSATV